VALDHDEGHQPPECVDVELAAGAGARAPLGPRPLLLQTIKLLPPTACCTCFSSIDSGPAPTNSTFSPTTVFGTDETRYFWASSGYPVTSMPSAVMLSLSIANRKARRTARGQ
jgi:hypothetical protein